MSRDTPPQLLSHLHASLGDELTDPSAVAKLPDAAQVKRMLALAGCLRLWAARANLAAKGCNCCVTMPLQARLLALLRPQGLHVGPS